MARAHPSTAPPPLRSCLLGLAAALATCSALLATGCANNNDELTKQLGQAQAEIRELRGSSLAAQDRLEALERQLEGLEQARQSAQALREPDRPSLPVVRLAPGGEEPPAAEGAPPAPDAPSPASLEPRLVLRGDRFGATLDAARAVPGGTAPAKAGGRPTAKAASPRPAPRPTPGAKSTTGAN